jgi:hypothetical protein
LDEVRAGRFTRRWDYVIVDGVHDLPPLALALAIELSRTPQAAFLAPHANQSLHNCGFRWRNVHDQRLYTNLVAKLTQYKIDF